MVTPDMGQMPPVKDWFAVDNACFAHPDDFDFDRFARFTERVLAEAGDRCLFVVTPDKPFDANETLRRFAQYRPQMAQFGAPVAFVTQDGMHPEDLPWGDIDALFVGGSTEWKLGSESGAIITEARRRGVWTHVGRVNSRDKFRAARSLGADSADGTILRYGFDYNWPRVKGWLDEQSLQPTLGAAR